MKERLSDLIHQFQEWRHRRNANEEQEHAKDPSGHRLANLTRWIAWFTAVSVVIAADHDGPGLKAAEAAADRWQSEGRRVRIARPDRAGADFNDILRERENG